MKKVMLTLIVLVLMLTACAPGGDRVDSPNINRLDRTELSCMEVQFNELCRVEFPDGLECVVLIGYEEGA